MNETFSVAKEFISEYVWATICVGKQRLEVYYQDGAGLIKGFEYTVNEEIRAIRDDIWKVC